MISTLLLATAQVITTTGGVAFSPTEPLSMSEKGLIPLSECIWKTGYPDALVASDKIASTGLSSRELVELAARFASICPGTEVTPANARGFAKVIVRARTAAVLNCLQRTDRKSLTNLRKLSKRATERDRLAWVLQGLPVPLSATGERCDPALTKRYGVDARQDLFERLAGAR